LSLAPQKRRAVVRCLDPTNGSNRRICLRFATANPRLNLGYMDPPNCQLLFELFHERLQLLMHCVDALIDRLQIYIRLLRGGV